MSDIAADYELQADRLRRLLKAEKPLNRLWNWHLSFLRSHIRGWFQEAAAPRFAIMCWRVWQKGITV